MNKTITLPNYISGQWSRSKSSSAQDVLNPATGEILSKVPFSELQEVDQTVTAAREAFGQWRSTPVTERIKYLFKLRQKVEANVDSLAETITREAGKTFKESRGELTRLVENIEVACGAPTLMQGYNSEDIASGIDETMIRQPIGVSAVIAPFNFPAMVPFWFIPYAIAAGNTCIVKPSERVPNTMQQIFELIDAVGLPEGVINMVHGGADVSNAILEHPDIDSISFVGSTSVAKKIYSKAAKYGKRVQASGGAKNPIIILPDADPEASTRIVSNSAFGCAGQRCLAASLAITVGDADKVFKDSLSDSAANLNVGNGLDEGTEMGPVISPQSKSRISALLDEGVAEGAEILIDGRRPEGKKYHNGNFIRPTLINDLNPENMLAKTEIFGPVLSLMHVETVDDAIALINSGKYGNMASLFTQSGTAARKFRYEAEVGNIGINIGVAAPMAFFPFSGWKDSFFGDLHGQGRDAFRFFTRQKVVVERWLTGWSREF
jgi:malonate-semialdehyde dehydrogenase (acetylating)/methylmalonate-semialdehyde dehydrogenase